MVQFQLESFRIGCDLDHVRCLEIPIVAGRLQARAAKLRGDIFGRQIEPARRRVAALQKIGRQEREMPSHGLRGDTVQRGLPRDRRLGGGKAERKQERTAGKASVERGHRGNCFHLSKGMMDPMRLIWHVSAILLTLAPLAAAAEYVVYVGTYTNNGKSEGIYAYRFDSNTGKLTDIGLAGKAIEPLLREHFIPTTNICMPSAKCRAPRDSRPAPSLSFSIDPKTAKLTPLNQVPSRGNGPCYVAIDKTGKAALVANYNSGSVALMPVKADGSLGEASAFDQREGKGSDARRQSAPHAHSIFASPDNRFALSADLGLDRLYVYKLDPAAGTLTPNDPPYASVKPGGGPRHFDFHPNGKFVYVIHEMGSGVTAFSYDKARGAMTEVQYRLHAAGGFQG